MTDEAVWAGQLSEERGYERAVKREAPKVAISASVSRAKIATNMWLRTAWLALIPSFGLSIIYVNIHVFLHMLFPSLFGKLGEEWVPGQEPLGYAVGGAKLASRTIGLGETMLLIAMDLFMVLVIIGIIAVIMALIDSLYGLFGWILSWFS